MTNLTRLESDNLRRLEEMRSTFEKLRAERIRAEGEVDRLTRELERARERAKSEFGTDDEAEIQRMIEGAVSQNARLVDEFGAALRDIEARLKQLGSER
jgi:FMN phosphatase YigB (HAD superfamily)